MVEFSSIRIFIVWRFSIYHMSVFKLPSMAVSRFEWSERESIPKSSIFTLLANRPLLLRKFITSSSGLQMGPCQCHWKGISISYNFHAWTESQFPLFVGQIVVQSRVGGKMVKTGEVLSSTGHELTLHHFP